MINLLTHAVLKAHVEVIEYLLSLGARFDVTNGRVETAIHFAALEGHVDVRTKVSTRRRNGGGQNYGETASHLAASKGHLDVMQCLLSKGDEQADTTDDLGFTAFHVATSTGHVHVVKYRLDEAVQANIPNNYEGTNSIPHSFITRPTGYR